MYASHKGDSYAASCMKKYISKYSKTKITISRKFTYARILWDCWIPLAIISLRNIYILYFIIPLVAHKSFNKVSLQGNKSFWREIWISLESANRIVFINISCINVHSKLTCFFFVCSSIPSLPRPLLRERILRSSRCTRRAALWRPSRKTRGTTRILS